MSTNELSRQPRLSITVEVHGGTITDKSEIVQEQQQLQTDSQQRYQSRQGAKARESEETIDGRNKQIVSSREAEQETSISTKKQRACIDDDRSRWQQ